QLRHHALGELAHAALHVNLGALQKALRDAAIEARMHALAERQSLPDTHPARQHRDVGHEAHLAHQRVALPARVEPEYVQLPAEGSKPEDRLERGGLAGAVRADEADDASRLDVETHA